MYHAFTFKPITHKFGKFIKFWMLFRWWDLFFNSIDMKYSYPVPCSFRTWLIITIFTWLMNVFSIFFGSAFLCLVVGSNNLSQVNCPHMFSWSQSCKQQSVIEQCPMKFYLCVKYDDRTDQIQKSPILLTFFKDFQSQFSLFPIIVHPTKIVSWSYTSFVKKKKKKKIAALWTWLHVFAHCFALLLARVIIMGLALQNLIANCSV